ncbi:MAG: hypothetical protein JXR48_15945 [Candidatus Delongbacteria bacterium]|nr:hypothetical protein [Candidatus Delongbacteria bacterium]MBN2836450.1 hypothetical protein [Candidatus Delongbacteria bacterium]
MKFLFISVITVLLLSCSKKYILKNYSETPKFDIQESEMYQNSNSFQQDFIYMVQALKSKHPDLYFTLSKEEFDDEYSIVMQKLNVVESEIEFQIIVQQFLAKLNDGHTNLALFDIFDCNEIFPIQFKFIDNHLYILNIDKSFRYELIGKEIKRINNKPVLGVLKGLGSFISAENEFHKMNILSKKYLNNPTFLKTYDFIKTDSLNLTIAVNDTDENLVLPISDDFDFYKTKENTHYITSKKSTPFYYSLIENEKIAYFQFNMFMDFNVWLNWVSKAPFFLKPIIYPVGFVHKTYSQAFNEYYTAYFDNFLEEMFTEINKKNITNLIIDLRNNGGGNSTLGKQFIKYIPTKSEELKDFMVYPYWEYFKKDTMTYKSDFFSQVDSEDSDFYIKPSVQYNGNIYILIGENTFSSAVDFATLLKDNNIGNFVGTPTGGKPSSFGDLVFVKLPNHENILGHSWKFFQRPDRSKDKEITLWPDYVIYPSINDIINGDDAQFDFIINKILIDKR